MSDGGEYAFTILPPWYRTWWSYAGYAGFLGLAVFGVDRLQRRRLLGKERERAQFAEARLRAESAEALARTESEGKKQVELLSDIGREITASLDFDTIFGKLYERVNQLADADVFGVGLYHPEKKQIEYRLAIEEGKRYAPYTRDTSDPDQLPVWCIEHRKPVFINDLSTEYTKYVTRHEEKSQRLEDGSMSKTPQSLIYLPLEAKDRVLGLITIQSFEKGAYTDHHLNVMQSLASYTAVALDNAAAYRQLNEQEHENRRLFEEAQRARAAAEDADAAKSAFLSTVSHELRTPLTSVLGFAKIIRKRLEDRIFPLVHSDDKKVQQTIQQVQDNLKVVVSEGERLTKLIDDVLDLAKIEAGKLEWHMEAVSAGRRRPPRHRRHRVAVRAEGPEVRHRRRSGSDHRDGRPRSAHPSGHQPDFERREVHRRRVGDLSCGAARRSAGRERVGHGHGHLAGGSAQGVRAVQAGGRHAHRQAEGHGPGPADLQGDRRAPRRAHLGGKRDRQGLHVLLLAAAPRRRRGGGGSRPWPGGPGLPHPAAARPGRGHDASLGRPPAAHPGRGRRGQHPRAAHPGVHRSGLPGTDGEQRARGREDGARRASRSRRARRDDARDERLRRGGRAEERSRHDGHPDRHPLDRAGPRPRLPLWASTAISPSPSTPTCCSGKSARSSSRRNRTSACSSSTRTPRR